LAALIWVVEWEGVAPAAPEDEATTADEATPEFDGVLD